MSNRRRVVRYDRIYTIRVTGKSDVRDESEPMTLELADQAIVGLARVLDEQFAQRSVTIGVRDKLVKSKQVGQHAA